MVEVEQSENDGLQTHVEDQIALHDPMPYVTASLSKLPPKGPIEGPIKTDKCENLMSDCIFPVTEQAAKIAAGSQCSGAPKRSAIRSIRRIKHYTPYSTLEEPTAAQPCQITLTQILKHKKIGRPIKKYL